MKLLRSLVNMVMKNVFALMLLLFLVGSVNAGIYYEVNLDYDNGSLSVNSVDVIYDRGELLNLQGEMYDVSYLFDLFDYEGSVVLSEDVGVLNFDFNETLYPDNPDDDFLEIVYKDRFNFSVFFPYSEDVNLIVVKSVGGDVAEEIDVRTYAKVRGELEVDDEGVVFVKKNDRGGSGRVKDGDGGDDSNVLFYLFLGIVIIVLIYFGYYFFLNKKRGIKGFIKK